VLEDGDAGSGLRQCPGPDILSENATCCHGNYGPYGIAVFAARDTTMPGAAIGQRARRVFVAMCLKRRSFHPRRVGALDALEPPFGTL
jgi:hypothetical protein